MRPAPLSRLNCRASLVCRLSARLAELGEDVEQLLAHLDDGADEDDVESPDLT